ncbi:amidase [Corynebacterium phocae]|uniref:nicotinamidase n=1 Tax=Corynebacterium phocae TaxID=161895 RepID=A0A1L7D1Y1_9CORY|nr:isochorismatase family protein [Corynebacterium phocae]APT92032.1 amidase [Corynebacterium phocae]KAA8726414.1 isochorismatase family protein [Corynebacterium phocae]
MNSALVIVDVQKDFCPGGALGTARGNEVAEKISELQKKYDTVVATQDWHIEPGDHFSADPDFVDSWPPHCVVGSEGAQMHPAIGPAQEYFRKGEYTAAYSGFEGANAKGVGLAQWLRERGIGSVDIVGIATDHCVKATAADALREGFAVTVLEEYCSPVDPERAKAALAELKAQGAAIK